jgi:site-specific recombinase XerD
MRKHPTDPDPKAGDSGGRAEIILTYLGHRLSAKVSGFLLLWRYVMTKILSTQNIDALIKIVLGPVDSLETVRAYRRALQDFKQWYIEHGQGELSKAVIQSYALELKEKGMNAGNINLRLIAIRRLAAEAADNGTLDPVIVSGILRIKGMRAEGRHLGNWLTKAQAQDLLNSVDTSTLKGKRDKAILAVLLSCGLRREEASELTFEHIQQRENRWVIVDLIGKRNSMRSIPIPNWCKVAIDQWAQAAGIKSGCIFRRIRRGDHLASDCMTAQAIYDVVLNYARKSGFNLVPHDCRRTFAKLAHKGGSPIEQIQYSLGHASITTTQIYLGIEQNLTDAPCDHLGLAFVGN